jgi:glycosyltransferase involved in cell wall biosynthesis
MASDSVASDLSYASQLRRKIEASDINQNVRWTGFAPSSEVSACLSAADICVLPFRDGASFRNGTLVAAIAHHLVLVTTAQPRNPAVESIAKRSGLMLQDGVNARLAPPQEPMLLAQAISELARQPEQRRQLRQGMQELSRLTTWETIATQTIRVYREVLGNA